MERDSKPVSGVCKRVSAVLTRPVIAIGKRRSIPRLLVLSLLESKRYRDLYVLIEEYWKHDPEDLELARSLLVLERYFQWQELAQAS